MNELIQLGRETFEFGSRGIKRLNRRLLGKRNQVAQVQGAKNYKHAKELDSYDIMDDYIPVSNRKGRFVKRGQLESPADIQQKISRKRMEGMQRARGKTNRIFTERLNSKSKVRKVGKYMRDADDRIVGLAG